MELERFWIKMCSPVFLNIRPANKHMETYSDYNSKLGSKGKARLDFLENITLWHYSESQIQGNEPAGLWQSSNIKDCPKKD